METPCEALTDVAEDVNLKLALWQVRGQVLSGGPHTTVCFSLLLQAS